MSSDVLSETGERSTVRICLPETREDVPGRQDLLPMPDYLAKGESILVVYGGEEGPGGPEADLAGLPGEFLIGSAKSGSPYAGNWTGHEPMQREKGGGGGWTRYAFFWLPDSKRTHCRFNASSGRPGSKPAQGMKRV
jgi:hypothetical protein